MDFWRDFPGPNAGYVLELYERYRDDPASVDAQTRAFFEHWTPPSNGHSAVPAVEKQAAVQAVDVDKIMGVVNLAQAIRGLGYLAGRLDPLGSPPPGDPALELEAHGLTERDLEDLPASLVGGPVGQSSSNAGEAIRTLRSIYSSTTGYDTDHITVPEERDWLRDAAERGTYRPPQMPIDEHALLERLTQVEGFEQFLHRTFPGKHRFSVEGLDVMIPMLDEVVCGAAGRGVRSVLIGMAHRGRLNVLAHILHKPYRQMLAEFKDPVAHRIFREDLGWTGDVKYHKGAFLSADQAELCDVAITLLPNPSHLELVNPLVEGMTRAAGSDVNRGGAPQFDPLVTLPVLIHGDAAFPGQGIVAETLNLSGLPGYWTGGTVHLIANNQLGYTAEPEDSRSTRYASTLAKGFRIPIVHVNADDPVACIEAARLAFAYRERFQRDFVIDLIGYRRYGHNEGDEPAFTQPLMYATIEQHPTVRALWAQTLVDRGALDDTEADALLAANRNTLQVVWETLDPVEDLAEPEPEPPPRGTASRVKTTVAVDLLQQLNETLLTLPDDFTMHRKLARALDRRREALKDVDAPVVDWATAEELALATILADGVAIRMTGEDTERGTFSQRHAVFHDVKTGATFTPLQALPQANAAFEIHDSPLSENAALGFEYGYNIQAPHRLVVWEAQYGDFINGAQPIIDEYISAARAKWGQTPSLVLLLPHGYEGAGPDHSSARLERFLALAAEKNMRIVNCTTAAQYFHVLRRQAALLEADPLPLIVMTPKSLLRHPLVSSSLRALAEGGWQPVIDDPLAQGRVGEVQRLFLCSGKIYVDLISGEQREQHPEVAIARVEQLYPFPADDVTRVLDCYPKLEEVVWVQEEPANMGAWPFMGYRLRKLIGGRWPLRYVGRTASSSPAEGSSAWHTRNQETLVKQAYDRGPDEIAHDFIIS
ncbi:2-oxoglutarate dehydrogenase E1 component [Aggregatilinea lenta]|uniref:2-oxoglutarate dehydrogenase E1 component n=1 Tax=Aggregatilinea lenta TaxID=913108 RepID=UPI000E5A7CB7|nr:2-oxoglutarate dehydrogenase E1 component [Aggregatilinea lenta]